MGKHQSISKNRANARESAKTAKTAKFARCSLLGGKAPAAAGGRTVPAKVKASNGPPRRRVCLPLSRCRRRPASGSPARGPRRRVGAARPKGPYAAEKVFRAAIVVRLGSAKKKGNGYRPFSRVRLRGPQSAPPPASVEYLAVGGLAGTGAQPFGRGPPRWLSGPPPCGVCACLGWSCGGGPSACFGAPRPSAPSLRFPRSEETALFGGAPPSRAKNGIRDCRFCPRPVLAAAVLGWWWCWPVRGGGGPWRGRAGTLRRTA